MTKNNTRLLVRKNTYYIRVAIPKCIQHLVKRQEFRYSLNTKDYIEDFIENNYKLIRLGKANFALWELAKKMLIFFADGKEKELVLKIIFTEIASPSRNCINHFQSSNTHS